LAESQSTPRIFASLQQRWLLLTALLLALAKGIQFAIDSTPIYFFDSGAFLQNALGLWFIPERSPAYGALIHVFGIPFHSMRAVVAMQLIMGGLTAWLLTFFLIRLLNVRVWIAILAALIFAFDPMQVTYEHLVMTEATSILISAVFLCAALAYLRKPALFWPVILSFLGILLVSLRMVYVPVVFATAVLLPLLAACFSPSARRPRILVLALALSCGSTLLFHEAYQHLTGRLAGREPAYHYRTGFFLAAAVAPILEPLDAADPAVAMAVVEQAGSRLPLIPRFFRSAQIWNRQDGLRFRLIAVFHGDETAANRAAGSLARAAILRNPLGFLDLGWQTYLDYGRQLGNLTRCLHQDIDQVIPELEPGDGPPYFRLGLDVAKRRVVVSPSSRYYILGGWWCLFLLSAPFLALLALWLRPDLREAAALLLLWDCLLLAATCLGAAESSYRYLHPFSLPGVIAAAMLVDGALRKSRSRA
jgi:hypothetical protein